MLLYVNDLLGPSFEDGVVEERGFVACHAAMSER